MGKKKVGLAERAIDWRRSLVEPEHPQLSIVRQCELLEMSRSGYYYEPVPESAENLALMRLIDEQYLETPFYGYRRMAAHPVLQGHSVNDKRIGRLMRLMGLEALYQKPRTSIPNKEHIVYPYLLRNVPIERVNQVWNRYYLRPDGAWLLVFGCCYGLVQSVCPFLAFVQHDGCRFLHRGAE